MTILQTAVLCVTLAVLWKTLPSFFSRPTLAYGGYVHPDFQEVKDIFVKNIESGREPGASFAAYHNGQVLVDLWGGMADPEAKRAWQQNTLSQVWSCTKGVVAVVIAMLVDRGLVDYNENVYKYWPEFRNNGKENVTVGMLLSHQAGLVSLPRQVSLLEYRDNWAEVEKLMAEATPAWPPGSVFTHRGTFGHTLVEIGAPVDLNGKTIGMAEAKPYTGTKYAYHAYTYGMFADAILRKVDPKHRNISQFFQEEIAQPFGFDFYVGLPLEMYHRMTRASFTPIWKIMATAFITRPDRWKWLHELLPGNTIHRSMNAIDISNDMNTLNNPDLQAIGLSSAVGFGTARSLAQFYDYLANEGSIKGKRLLSERQIAALSTPVTENIPGIGFPDDQFAMGTAVGKNVLGERIFGHGGYGGQAAYADPGHGIGVTYITNFNSQYSESIDPRAFDLLTVLYKCMQKYKLRRT